MARFFNNLFAYRKSDQPPPPTTSRLTISQYNTLSDPELAPGLPSVPVNAIIDDQHELVEDLRHSLGLSLNDYTSLLRPVLNRLASHLHLLPASEHYHNAGPGGLWKHSIETAFHASRHVERVVFDEKLGLQERDRRLPLWRFAAVLGGLLHDLGMSITDVGARDADGRQHWNPYTEPLFLWLTRHHISNYHVQWNAARHHRRHEWFALPWAREIIGPELISLLTGRETDILESCFLVLAGGSERGDALRTSVSIGDQTSVADNLKATAEHIAANGWGEPHTLGLRLMHAMHREILEGAWQPNQPGSPVFVSQKGVFIVVPRALQLAAKRLRERGSTDIPVDHMDLGQSIIGHGIVRQFGEDGAEKRPTCTIEVDFGDSGKHRFASMQIALPDLLFDRLPLPNFIHLTVLDRGKVVE